MVHSSKLDVRYTHFQWHHKNQIQRKKISIDGLSEFQWNEIEAGQKLTFEAGFRVAYKANFNKNTVVAKRLRSLCLPKKVGC